MMIIIIIQGNVKTKSPRKQLQFHVNEVSRFTAVSLLTSSDISIPVVST